MLSNDKTDAMTRAALMAMLLPTTFALAPPIWGWTTGDIPGPRTHDTIVYSPCGNNGYLAGPDVGFACPHMLMYSTDMMLAASYDGLDDTFIYAVAGSSGDQDCGHCYQVQPLDAESWWDDSLAERQILLQVVNSGPDVMPGQFDIFMGAGGFGYFTACTSDCRTNYCGGGACADGMYDRDYAAWNPTPNCYGGGLRHLNESGLIEACQNLTGDSPEYKNQVLWQSCVESNLHLYHQNFINTNVLPVQCPDGLVRLTGLRRSDDDHLPQPHPGNDHTIHCRGSKESNQYCMTSMQDCCMPSCSWMNKGSPDPLWAKADSCRKDGTVWNKA